MQIVQPSATAADDEALRRHADGPVRGSGTLGRNGSYGVDELMGGAAQDTQLEFTGTKPNGEP